MVEKWTLCIDIYFSLNPGKEVITYVLSNIVTSKVLQRKMNIPGRTTNNDAYYIALIEGLEKIGSMDQMELEFSPVLNLCAAR